MHQRIVQRGHNAVDVKTENTSVVAFQIAWDMCKGIDLNDAGGKKLEPGTEAYVLRLGEVIYAVYIKVLQGVQQGISMR
jgi:hypothetical protein